MGDQMDMQHIMFTALAGGAGAAIGALIVSLLPLKGNARGLAFGIAAVVGLSIGSALVNKFVPDESLEIEFAKALDKAPLVDQVVKHDPARRQQYVDRLASAARQGGQDAAQTEMNKIAGEVVAQVFRPSLPKASPEALASIVDVQADNLALLYEGDPDGCYAYVSRTPGLRQPGLAKELRERMTKAMAEVVESARLTPVTLSVEGRDAGEALLADITKKLLSGPESASLYAGDYAGQKASTAEERKGACLFTLRLYQGLQALPLVQRDPALRLLLPG